MRSSAIPTFFSYQHKHAENLTGFIYFGDTNINNLNFEKKEDLATHALVLLVRCVISDLKYCLVYFATNTATRTQQIMPLFWEAVVILESLGNGSLLQYLMENQSPNQRFYQVHKAIHAIHSDYAIKRNICNYAMKPWTSLQNQDIFTFTQTLPIS